MMARPTKISIPATQTREIAEVAALLARRKPTAAAGIFVAGPDGRRDYAELPPQALTALGAFLSALAEGGEALVIREEDEATPAEAAEILGISRPLVYQRMDDGRLPFRRVGSHRRIRVRDVLALQPEEEQRQRAASELAQDTDEIEHARSTQGAA